MLDVSRRPLTRESVEGLLAALDQCGGDFVRFGKMGGQARQARTPEELAALALPMPAPDLLRHADDLGRLQALWSAFGGHLSRWGSGFDDALKLLRRTAGTRLADTLLAGATEDELRVLDALAPRIQSALSPFRTATMQGIAANLETARESTESAHQIGGEQIGADDPEALQWLRANGQKGPLASNRFAAEEALEFVEALYAAGAERVVIAADSIRDDEQERSLGGPYADSLRIQLPADAARRRVLFEIANREMEDEGFDPVTDDGQETILLWWD